METVLNRKEREEAEEVAAFYESLPVEGQQELLVMARVSRLFHLVPPKEEKRGGRQQ
ncbi:MAG: hypothetical protein Q4C60_02030 [Eubacteriales bacterium]|nr:hypothetical protein [Eubacteriales bacterium]